MSRKTFGRNPDGTYNRKTFYGSTAAEAAQKLNDYEKQVNDGLNADADALTVEQWLRIWLREYKYQVLRPHTYDTYEQFIDNSIVPAAFSKYKLLKLRPEHLQAYVNGLKKENGEPFSLSSIKQLKCILNGAFGQALKNGLITKNPVDALSLPKTSGKRKIGAFTKTEQSALLSALEGHRLYPLFVLALGIGMRIGELLALKHSNINWDNREITVEGSASRSKDRNDNGDVVEGQAKSSVKIGAVKTDSGFRVVPMTNEVVQVLQKHKKDQAAERLSAGSAWSNNDFVFCTALGGQLEYRNVVRLYSARRDAAGISSLPFHSLRHSFATNAIAAGMDYYYLSRIMGHANISLTLDTYTDFMPDKSRSEMSKMEGLMSLKFA